jgi:hypothetical protein
VSLENKEERKMRTVSAGTTGGETTRLRGILSVSLLTCAFALAPCYVNAADTDKPAESPQKGQDQKAASSEKVPKPPDDLSSCRRDADGMRGPERSRFMTSCLRERK